VRHTRPRCRDQALRRAAAAEDRVRRIPQHGDARARGTIWRMSSTCLPTRRELHGRCQLRCRRGAQDCRRCRAATGSLTATMTIGNRRGRSFAAIDAWVTTTAMTSGCIEHESQPAQAAWRIAFGGAALVDDVRRPRSRVAQPATNGLVRRRARAGRRATRALATLRPTSGARSASRPHTTTGSAARLTLALYVRSHCQKPSRSSIR
jgi:hypothetical protein